VIEYNMIMNPDNSKPKLKIDATSLSTECPRSLRALFPQLNQGTSIMQIIIDRIPVKGPSNPSNANFRSLMALNNLLLFISFLFN
jgi:hypothetical protein